MIFMLTIIYFFNKFLSVILQSGNLIILFNIATDTRNTFEL